MINIGKILKTHGVHGNVKVFVEAFFVKELTQATVFFIDKIPYFVEIIQKSSSIELIMKFEEVDSKETAQQLCGKDLYIDATKVKKWKLPLAEDTLIGFSIYNQQQFIGKILDIVEMPQQMMLVTEINFKEILIPLNEDLLLEINPEQEKIVLNLPENYIEIFLE